MRPSTIFYLLVGLLLGCNSRSEQNRKTSVNRVASLVATKDELCGWKISDISPVIDVSTDPEGLISKPVFADLVQDSGRCLAFVTGHYPGSLTRVDFGSSFSNTPKITHLGNPGHGLSDGYGAEAVRIIRYQNSWWLIAVGGSNYARSGPRITVWKLGDDLFNEHPETFVFKSDILDQPIDLEIAQTGKGNLVGFVSCCDNNRLVKIDFPSDLSRQPRLSIVQEIGLNYPTGLALEESSGTKSLLLINARNTTMVKLEFKDDWNSHVSKVHYLPTSELGEPRDLLRLPDCHDERWLIADEDGFIRESVLDEKGIKGTLAYAGGEIVFPHSFSKLVTEGEHTYTFVPDAATGNILRITFSKTRNESFDPAFVLK